MVLVGNKSDLTESRSISTERGQEVADSLGIQYFETSAKDGIHINQTFDTLVDEISEKMAESIENNPNFQRRGNRRSLGESDSERKSSASGCSC